MRRRIFTLTGMDGNDGKETPLYKSMKVRYRDLKVILSALGVNVTELDTIKE